MSTVTIQHTELLASCCCAALPCPAVPGCLCTSGPYGTELISNATGSPFGKLCKAMGTSKQLCGETFENPQKTRGK